MARIEPASSRVAACCFPPVRVTCLITEPSVKPPLTFRKSSNDLQLPRTLPSRQPAGQGAAVLRRSIKSPDFPAQKHVIHQGANGGSTLGLARSVKNFKLCAIFPQLGFLVLINRTYASLWIALVGFSISGGASTRRFVLPRSPHAVARENFTHITSIF